VTTERTRLPSQRTTEDYIKCIYTLQQSGDKVTTSALAARLNLADASVTDMVKKLSERGYVQYEPYQGVLLTAGGRRMALKIIRRHRLWEMFLVQFLGYSWDKVHDEAERLEHVTSDELEQRLDIILRRPALDPHGDPIPTSSGVMEMKHDIALAECLPGASVRVHRVSDDNREVLRHVTRMGLTLNTRLTVKEKTEFDGSMVVKVGSRNKYLSRRIAGSIFVQPV
jgi:DtxR family transcriptional regulator, Mn-dependent transcriptional regulator